MNAQENTHTKNNYVVLTSKIAQLKPIILAAESLKSEEGNNFGDFQVIICGKEISDIADPTKIDTFIEMAQNAGVTLVACGFSLNKFKVEKSKVPAKMKVVENGILYNFQLQKKGYFNLSL